MGPTILEVTDEELIWRLPFYIPTPIIRMELSAIKAIKGVRLTMKKIFLLVLISLYCSGCVTTQKSEKDLSWEEVKNLNTSESYLNYYEEHFYEPCASEIKGNVSAKAKPNETGDIDYRLLLATQCGYWDDIKELVEAGVNLELKTRLGKTALNILASKGRGNYENLIDHVMIVVDESAFLQEKKQFPNVAAAFALKPIKKREKDRLEAMQFLIDAGADINTKDNEGGTPLMRALYRRDINAAHLLMKNGAAKYEQISTSYTGELINKWEEKNYVKKNGRIILVFDMVGRMREKSAYPVLETNNKYTYCVVTTALTKFNGFKGNDDYAMIWRTNQQWEVKGYQVSTELPSAGHALFAIIATEITCKNSH